MSEAIAPNVFSAAPEGELGLSATVPGDARDVMIEITDEELGERIEPLFDAIPG